MFLHAIDTDAAAPLADCPIRRDLAQLAASLDTRFLRVGATLAAAVELTDRVIGGLDAIAAALDARTAGAAVADMRHVADRLNALPAARRLRAARMAAASEAGTALDEHVLDMHQTLRVLGIYGTNIKIAASGEEQFVGFVDGMTEKLADGDAHLAGFIERLKALMAAVASERRGDRLLAEESAKVLPAVPLRLAADAADLSGYLGGVAVLAKTVAAIARSIQAKVAVVLGAMQVGDSTRQRLEHVVAALQIVEIRGVAAEPAAAAHVERLLAAQVDAALADFTRETGAMLRSLADLVPDTRRLLDLITGQDGGGGRILLARIDQGIGDVERVTTRLREAERRSREMVALITDTVRDLSHRLASVRRIRLDMQDIATNTRLLCRRHGTIGKAVAVIAVEVDALTARLGEATDGVGQAIARLGDIEASLRGEDDPDVRDIGEVLASALAVIRHACHRVEDVAGIGGDDARQLITLLDGVADELGGELAVRDAIAAAAGAIARRTPPADLTDDAAAMLATLLPAIAAMYTMASEREVHAGFVLPGMAAPAPPADADDEDDDGLF